MSKRKPSYTRANVMCGPVQVYHKAEGLELDGLPLDGAVSVLVTVKQEAPRNKHEREFCHFAVKQGVWVRECSPGAECTMPTREWLAEVIGRTGSATFEAYGTAEALEAFLGGPYLERWQWRHSGGPSVRISGQGQGEEKAKGSGKVKAKPNVIWGGTREDNGMTAKPNEQTKWESHTDAMGKLVKGVASLPE